MAAVTPEPYPTGSQPPGIGDRVHHPAARRYLSRPSARSLGPAPRELVVATGALQPCPLPPGLVGGLRRQLGQRPVDLLPDPAERDPEHPLPAGQQIHHLIGRGALVDADAVAHEGEPCQVLRATVTEMVDGGADLLQRNPGVEQALDDLEHEDVAEAVKPLRPRPVRGTDAGLHQRGTRPVVKLAVGDPGGGAGGGAPGADVPGVSGEVFPEQEALLAGALDRGATVARLAAVFLGYRHTRLRP